MTYSSVVSTTDRARCVRRWRRSSGFGCNAYMSTIACQQLTTILPLPVASTCLKHVYFLSLAVGTVCVWIRERRSSPNAVREAIAEGEGSWLLHSLAGGEWDLCR